jgi:hypothetical protein
MKLSLERLTALSYQGAKQCIKKMSEEDAKQSFTELKDAISCMYEQCNQYGEIEYGHIHNGPNDDHAYIKSMTVSDKEYQKTMGRLKKFEIIYGYLFDRLASTTFMEVRG